MTDRTLREKVRSLQALQGEIDQLTARADSLKAQIKIEMQTRAVDELKTGNVVIRWKPVTITRLDQKAFREAHSRLYEQFAVESTMRRFTLIPA